LGNYYRMKDKIVCMYKECLENFKTFNIISKIGINNNLLTKNVSKYQF